MSHGKTELRKLSLTRKNSHSEKCLEQSLNPLMFQNDEIA